MSVTAMGMALEAQGISPRAKVILIAISNCANEYTFEGWPPRKDLARIADCSLDTVDRCIRELGDTIPPLLKKTERCRDDGGGLTSNLYRVFPDHDPSRKTAATPQVQAEPSRTDAARGGRKTAATSPQDYAAPLAAKGAAREEPLSKPEESRIVSARGDVSVPVSKEVIGALIARAGDACDPTAPSLHHGAQLNRLLRGGCLWADDIEPACDQVAASFRRRGKRFSSWELLIEHAVANRDARLAGVPAPQPVADQPRRNGGRESMSAVIDRVFAEQEAKRGKAG